MPELYREALCVKYRAPRISCAYLWYWACAISIFLLPFFLAYGGTPDFWLKQDTYLEQPRVEYQKKLAVILEGFKSDASGNKSPIRLFYSTVGTANTLLHDALRVPVLRSIGVDENYDGLMDRLDIDLSMPIEPRESIHSVQLLAFFDYKLRSRAKLAMESVAYVSHSSPLPGRELFAHGELQLRQRWPLQVLGGYLRPYTEAPLLNDSYPAYSLDAKDLRFADIIAQYHGRNVTTDFVCRDAVWSSETRSGVSSLVEEDERSTFRVRATVRVPVQEVMYSPTVTEVLRDAWTKYLARLVVVWYLLGKVNSFLFANQIVESSVTSDVGPRLKQQ